MRFKTFGYGLLVVLLVVGMGWLSQTKAIESWTQTLMTDLASGSAAKGNAVLQVGEVNTLSAAVASGTRTQVVAAPSAGSIYLRGVFVEKVSGTPTFTLSYGTGTNCGTGTTTLLGPVTPINNYIPIGIAVPATKALCVLTDGTSTGVRALAQ